MRKHKKSFLNFYKMNQSHIATHFNLVAALFYLFFHPMHCSIVPHTQYAVSFTCYIGILVQMCSQAIADDLILHGPCKKKATDQLQQFDFQSLYTLSCLKSKSVSHFFLIRVSTVCQCNWQVATVQENNKAPDRSSRTNKLFIFLSF